MYKNNQPKFWFFIEMELFEITNNLKNELQFSDFYRDYENTWEWCESEDRQADIYINIAREHNWEHGIYTCPVILDIKRKNIQYSAEDINDIGLKISSTLGVKIYYGNITYLYDSEYRYEEIKVFK